LPLSLPDLTKPNPNRDIAAVAYPLQPNPNRVIAAASSTQPNRVILSEAADAFVSSAVEGPAVALAVAIAFRRFRNKSIQSTTRIQQLEFLIHLQTIISMHYDNVQIESVKPYAFL
jgi:hypothetical protein